MFTFEGTLKLVQKGRPFTDSKTGIVTPPKFTHFFQVEDDEGNSEVLQLRSKEDFSDLIDSDVVGTVKMFPMQQGSGFYISLDTLISAKER